MHASVRVARRAARRRCGFTGSTTVELNATPAGGTADEARTIWRIAAIVAPNLTVMQPWNMRGFMVGSTRPTSTAQPPARPFDPVVSLHLDMLIIELERNPSRWRRGLLQLRKLLAECNVPAYYPGEVAR